MPWQRRRDHVLECLVSGNLCIDALARMHNPEQTVAFGQLYNLHVGACFLLIVPRHCPFVPHLNTPLRQVQVG